jgi:hypothetical protein
MGTGLGEKRLPLKAARLAKMIKTRLTTTTKNALLA